MKNKILAYSLILLIIFSSVFSLTAFGVSDWAKEYITKYENYGLSLASLGDNLEENITRQQFSSIVVSLYQKTKGEITLKEDIPFKDTQDINVKKAYSIGIVKGISKDVFSPDSNITRQDICVMFDRLTALVKPDLAVTMQYIIFGDEESISDYAKNSVQLLYKINIIKGVGEDKIDPVGFCSKEQAVTMGLRAYELFTDKQTATNQTNTIIKQSNSTIAAGGYFSLGVSAYDNSLYGWGRNDNSQLGVVTDESNARQIAKIAKDVKYVATQSTHSFYIDKNNNLYGFGDNTYAQLGDGSVEKKTSPILITSDVESVVPLKDHTYIIKTDGSLYAFGKGENYKLGTNSDKDSLTPVKILDNVAKISTYSDCSMALTNDGKVYVWGQEKTNSFLFETQITYKQPTLIGEGATDIAIGNDFGLFVKQNGDLYAFGQNKFAQFGNGSISSSIIKNPIKVFDGVSKTYASNNMSIIIMQNGDVYSSGDNIDGRLGVGEENKDANVLTFTKISDNAKKLFINKNSVYLIKNDNKLYGWGDNSGFTLGDSSGNDRYMPVLISVDVSDITFGIDHVILIKTDGGVYCFGSNKYYQTSNVEKLSEFTPYMAPYKYNFNGLVIN